MRTKSVLSVVAVLAFAAIAFPGIAYAGCKEVQAALGDKIADVTCTESTDLTTNNPATTPGNNSILGLPVSAFTSQTDRNVISPDPPNRTPITKAVPGLQLNGRFAEDPTGEARFLLRLPNDWNGKLVVAGASGHAQRVQRRLRLERLRPPEGLRIRVAEQGRPESENRQPVVGDAACQ